MYRRKAGNYAKIRKSDAMTIRCTPEMKNKIEIKSALKKQSVSEYVMEQIETGMKRNTKGDKGKARVLVELQEDMNRIIQNLTPEQENIKKQLIQFSERMIGLWGF